MSQGLYEQAKALSTTVLNNEKNEKTDIIVVNSPNMRKKKLLMVVSHIRFSCMQHLRNVSKNLLNCSYGNL